MIFCKLCEKFGELQESHSVPNAFFSRLFELDSGKAIVTSNDYDDALNYTSDSWATKLLCKKCEGLMNESYDRYGIEVIRGRNLNVQRNEYGVKISKVNIRRFSTFIAAIIWRAAASDHVAYCNVDLNDDWFNRLRRIFLAGDYVSASEVSVRVNRLTCIKYGLSAELMKNLVCNPFFQQEGARRGWRFIVEGFSFDIFIPALPPSRRNGVDYLDFRKDFIFAPMHEVREHEGIFQAWLTSAMKHFEEKSKDKN